MALQPTRQSSTNDDRISPIPHTDMTILVKLLNTGMLKIWLQHYLCIKFHHLAIYSNYFHQTLWKTISHGRLVITFKSCKRQKKHTRACEQTTINKTTLSVYLHFSRCILLLFIFRLWWGWRVSVVVYIFHFWFTFSFSWWWNWPIKYSVLSITNK